MLPQISWGQGTDWVMKRDWFNINMYIYSLLLFIHVFAKMCINAGKLPGVGSCFLLFAKVTFWFSSSGNWTLRFILKDVSVMNWWKITSDIFSKRRGTLWIGECEIPQPSLWVEAGLHVNQYRVVEKPWAGGLDRAFLEYQLHLILLALWS